ncbi:MAG: preprotein translocase subunit SecG [Oscillospiraceae bacterium]|nr:preprotein translocase subunit SecG [Oscillospiraceae bacterium]
MEILKTVLVILEIIASVVMILVVMFQSGKEAGLSSALTGNADNYMSKSKFGNLDKTLASATKWIALVWALLTLSLSLI